jgi:small-conductance mechanosensitive channel
MPCSTVRRLDAAGTLSQRWRGLVAALAALLLCLVAQVAVAQSQGDIRTRLDQGRAELMRIDEGVNRDGADEKTLRGLRGQLEPLVERLNEIIASETPRLEGVRSRLEQLGPRPDPAKNQTESADVTRERAEQEKLQGEIDEVIRLARSLLVQADQLSAAIGDKRRALLARALMERTQSIASPWLWADVMRVLPLELRAFRVILVDWIDLMVTRIDGTRGLILALALGLIVVLAFPVRRFALRFEARDPAVTDPPRLSRALAALRVTLIWALVPFLICAGLFELLSLLDLIPGRAQAILRTALYGTAVVAFAHGLADGLLAPEDPKWRLYQMDDNTARRLTALASTFPAIMVIGKTVEAINQAIVAALPVTIATKGLFAVLAALAIIRTMQKLRANAEAINQEESSLGPVAPQGPGFGLPLRLFAWGGAIAILISAATGYIALAGFLSEQLLWITSVTTFLIVIIVLVDEVIGRSLSADGALGRNVMTQVGLKRGSLQQISVLSTGLLRVIAMVAAVMLVLAPWGLDGGDVFGTFRAAVFGFSIGGVTISLSAIVVAVVLFMIGFGATRSIQRWLEKSYLPHTGLDLGLRNSISTILGYIGIIIAAMLALSHLGFSMDKLTIVAGALSVGIGFGLQSIVNNFVSGLILLWERPIRVGDWIDVGTESGIVKRINVRSTQIETFDRASLIVPNSEFISGRVKNWMHNDRLGRIIIPLGIGYGSDPDEVRAILLNAALNHREVLSEPQPRVFFMRMAESSLDFELRCFTDVDSMLSVKSELLFTIFRSLREARIDIPVPQRPVEIVLAPNSGLEVKKPDDELRPAPRPRVGHAKEASAT